MYNEMIMNVRINNENLHIRQTDIIVNSETIALARGYNLHLGNVIYRGYNLHSTATYKIQKTISYIHQNYERVSLLNKLNRLLRHELSREEQYLIYFK